MRREKERKKIAKKKKRSKEGMGKGEIMHGERGTENENWNKRG